MFLVKDSSEVREKRIKQFLDEDPALSALLSVIHFEWTVRRAIVALGSSPNVVVRAKLKNCHGLDKYKDVWKDEVFPNVRLRLPEEVVKDWTGLGRAFRLRHRLVHGATSCGTEYAKERVYWAIEATNDVRSICFKKGINLDSRLPVRRVCKP
ncbi:hypothetical protein C7B76_15015 [filamentous cyanobacterium CCP2]|nr:hypothetical protein C7B76_15015 [filamentous cyanobacterium CCP2]